MVSPVLANLYLHYAFDMWLARAHPGVTFERYCDDAVIHCTSQAQAVMVRDALAARLAEAGLELHPGKTRVVYCKDADRRGDHEVTSFTFLGYTFRPRLAKNKWGKHFVNFLPAVSKDAVKAMSREIRSWHIARRSDKSLTDLAQMFSNIVQGWINYYGRFCKSMLYPLLRRINDHLMRWACRKYKRLRIPGLVRSLALRPQARWLDDGSRVSREASARFCERRGVRFPPPTLPVVHCVTEQQARQVRAALAKRLGSLGLTLHPDKTRIVYCRDGKRRGSYETHVFHVPGVHVPVPGVC